MDTDLRPARREDFLEDLRLTVRELRTRQTTGALIRRTVEAAIKEGPFDADR